MYFDAVEQILKLLKNPKLKLEKKLKLEAELKSIDPDSRIRNFIQNGGPRPDVSKGGQRYILDFICFYFILLAF